MATDIELLRRYAESKDENAFAELVERHVSFVYSAALRQLGGATHRAQDVTQTVFIQLARHSAKLIRSDEILGWLHTATHHAAANLKRSESRRQLREREAHTMQNDSTSSPPPASWEHVRPVLDEALLELDEQDRRAILLRFFQQARFSDLGRTLGLSEDAARMRVERALERLHARLSRRGITSTAGALALALSNHAMISAPTGLAATIASAAVAKATATAVAGGSAIGLFTMSTKSVILGMVAVIATGSAIYEFNESRLATAALATAQLERDQLRAQARLAGQRAAQADEDLLKLQSAVDAARKANAATEAKIAELTKGSQGRVFTAPAKEPDLLSRLAQPVLPPSNLDPRYAPAALKDEFVQISRNIGLNVKRAAVDDSEFPFLVYGQVDGNLVDLKSALNTTPGFTHGGSVSGSYNGTTYFAMSITPFDVISDAGDRGAARGRMMARLQMLAEKARSE